MFQFVCRKLINKKWMAICLLIGDLLLISVAMVNPMYAHAVKQRLLLRTMTDYVETENEYPALITQKVSYTADRASTEEDVQTFREMMTLYDSFGETLNVPISDRVCHLSLPSTIGAPVEPRSDEKETTAVTLGTMTGLENHIRLTAGRMYSTEVGDDGVCEVIVSKACIVRMNLLLNEELDVAEWNTRVRVVGVFETADVYDPYWVRSPSYYISEMFMPYELFCERFVDFDAHTTSLNGVFYTLLDYEQMRIEDVDSLLAFTDSLYEQYNKTYEKAVIAAYEPLLRSYKTSANKTDTTLTVLQVPMLFMLIVFLFMVSSQMLENEQNEISVLKSRGASKWQIMRVYLFQSALLALIGLCLSVPFSAFLCKCLGSSNAFLEFVKRKSLTIEYTPTVILYALVAAALSVGAMTLPALRYAKVSIVNTKQRRHAAKGMPLWQKLCPDIIGLGVSFYGLYSYNNQKAYLAERVSDGASLDPLLFLCSSLFILCASLFMLRIIPLIAKAVFVLFKKVLSPALYTSFTVITRDKSRQGFVMVFLMIAVAMGLFNADTARTINTNEVEQLRYDIGADVVFTEKWISQDSVYIEPDFGRYQTLDGVESVTRVYRDNTIALTISKNTMQDALLMGIHTREFGQTAYFPENLGEEHPFTLLNALAVETNGALINRACADANGVKVGDRISIRTVDKSDIALRVVGIFDYFPGIGANENVVIANLGKIQSEWGILPYQVWMRVSGSTSFIYDYADENDIFFSEFHDLSKEIVKLKNAPVIQGTNGLLTLSFTVNLLLCSVGFLIFWILSIRSRSLQFGIFRAMGMSMREVITMLLNEQLFISISSICAGIGIGKLSSKLFIPLISMTYSSAEMTLPMRIVSEGADMLRLMGVIGAVILCCMVVLGLLLGRMKITQTLKLGED